MRNLLLAVASVGLLSGPAHAVTLNFATGGSACVDGTCGSNGERISQANGDIAGQVDVAYDADRATAALDDLFWWSTGYESLTGVAYGFLGGGGLSIAFNAAAGYDVTVSGFDIAPFANRSRNTLVQIVDPATNTLLVDDTYMPLSTAGVTNYAGTWTSSVGIQINLGPDAWDVGIDNIEYSTALSSGPGPGPGPSPVPLPAGLPLLLAGLGAFSVIRRRQKRR